MKSLSFFKSTTRKRSSPQESPSIHLHFLHEVLLAGWLRGSSLRLLIFCLCGVVKPSWLRFGINALSVPGPPFQAHGLQTTSGDRILFDPRGNFPYAPPRGHGRADPMFFNKTNWCLIFSISRFKSLNRSDHYVIRNV